MYITESRVFWPVAQEAAAAVGYRAGILSLFVHCLLLAHLFDVCSWFSDIGICWTFILMKKIDRYSSLPFYNCSG